MPKILPHPIKTDSIAVYGRIIGIRKMRYVIPELITVDIFPTKVEFKEQALIADSTAISETPNMVESIRIGAGDMLSESPSRAETVVITNL